MFFIAKMHDSQYFSLILSLILYFSIEYGDVGIKRAAKRQKNRAEAEMTKRQHHKGLRVRRCEDPLRSDEALHRCEDLLRRSEPENLKSKASGSPQRSEVPFPLRELEKTLAFWAIDGPTSRGIKRE